MSARPNGGASAESKPKVSRKKQKRNANHEAETRFNGLESLPLPKICLARIDIAPFLNLNKKKPEQDTVSNEANKTTDEAIENKSATLQCCILEPEKSTSLQICTPEPDNSLFKCSVTLIREDLKKLQDALSKKVAFPAGSEPAPVELQCKKLKGNLKLSNSFGPSRPKKRVTFSEKVTVIEMREYHKCKKCPRIFDTRKVLKMHTRKMHKKHRQYICNYCQKIFMDRSFFKVHIKLHCYVCGLLLPSKAKCMEHRRKFCRVLYKCKSCDKMFSKQKHLREHSYEHIEPNLVCDYCDDKFTTKCAIAHHIKFLHSKRRPKFMYETRSLGTDRLYLCNFCDETTVDRALIERHLNLLPDLSNRVIKGQQGYYFCDQCKKDFITEKEMLEHKWTHFLRTSDSQESNDLQDLESIINSSDLIQDARPIMAEGLDDTQEMETLSNDDLEDITQIITESQESSPVSEYSDRSQSTTPCFAASTDDSQSLDSMNDTNYRLQDFRQNIALSDYNYHHINTPTFGTLSTPTMQDNSQRIVVNHFSNSLTVSDEYQHIEFINNANFGADTISESITENPDDLQDLEYIDNSAQDVINEVSCDSPNEGSQTSSVSITESFEDAQEMECFDNAFAISNQAQTVCNDVYKVIESVNDSNEESQNTLISITECFNEDMASVVSSNESQDKSPTLIESPEDAASIECIDLLSDGSQNTSTTNDSQDLELIDNFNDMSPTFSETDNVTQDMESVNNSDERTKHITTSIDDGTEVIESADNFNDQSENTSISVTKSHDHSQNKEENSTDISQDDESTETANDLNDQSQTTSISFRETHDHSLNNETIENSTNVLNEKQQGITENNTKDPEHIESAENVNNPSEDSQDTESIESIKHYLEDYILEKIQIITESHNDTVGTDSANNSNDLSQNPSLSVTESQDHSQVTEPIDNSNDILQDTPQSAMENIDDPEHIESADNTNEQLQNPSTSVAESHDHSQVTEPIDNSTVLLQEATQRVTENINDPEHIESADNSNEQLQNQSIGVTESRDHSQVTTDILQEASQCITENINDSEHIESADKVSEQLQNPSISVIECQDHSQVTEPIDDSTDILPEAPQSVTENINDPEHIESADKVNDQPENTSDSAEKLNDQSRNIPTSVTRSDDDSKDKVSVNNSNEGSHHTSTSTVVEAELIKSANKLTDQSESTSATLAESHDVSRDTGSLDNSDHLSQNKIQSTKDTDNIITKESDKNIDSTNSQSDSKKIITPSSDDSIIKPTPQIITESNAEPQDVSNSIPAKYNNKQNLPDIILDSYIPKKRKNTIKSKEKALVDNDKPEILSNSEKTKEKDKILEPMKVVPVIALEKLERAPQILPTKTISKPNLKTVYKFNEIPEEMLRLKVVLHKLKTPSSPIEEKSKTVQKPNKKLKLSPAKSTVEKNQRRGKKATSTKEKSDCDTVQNVNRKRKMTETIAPEEKPNTVPKHNNKRSKMGVSSCSEENSNNVNKHSKTTPLTPEKKKTATCDKKGKTPAPCITKKSTTKDTIIKKSKMSASISLETKTKTDDKILPSTSTEEKLINVPKIVKRRQMPASVTPEKKPKKSCEMTPTTSIEEKSNTVTKSNKKSKKSTSTTSADKNDINSETLPTAFKDKNDINSKTLPSTSAAEDSCTVKATDKKGKKAPKSKTSKQKSISLKKNVTSELLPGNVIPAEETTGYVSTSVSSDNANQEKKGSVGEILRSERHHYNSDKDSDATHVNHSNQNPIVHPNSKQDNHHHSIHDSTDQLKTKDTEVTHPNSNHPIQDESPHHSESDPNPNQKTNPPHSNHATDVLDGEHSNPSHDSDGNLPSPNHSMDADDDSSQHTNLPDAIRSSDNYDPNQLNDETEPNPVDDMDVDYHKSLSLSPLSLSPNSNEDTDVVNHNSNQTIRGSEAEIVCEIVPTQQQQLLVEESRNRRVAEKQTDTLDSFGQLKKMLSDKKPPKAREKCLISKHQCLVCGKYFSSGYCLRRHIREVHNNTESLQCMLCEEVFVWPSLLHSHKCIRLNHPELPFDDARPEIHFDNLQADGETADFGGIGIIENNSLAVDFEIPEPAVRYRQQLGQTELRNDIIEVETQNNFVHTPPHTFVSSPHLEENNFVHTPPHSFVTPPHLEENSFVHTTANQIEGQTGFVHTSPHHIHLEVNSDVNNDFVHTPPHCFGPTPPHHIDSQSCFGPTPPHQADSLNCFGPTPPHQADSLNCFGPTPPHQADSLNCFGPTPPHQADSLNCFGPTPPHQTDTQNCFGLVNTPPHQSDVQNCFGISRHVDAQNDFAHTSPQQVDAQNDFGQTSPHQVDAQSGFGHTSPHEVDAQNCFEPSPPHQVDAQHCFEQTSPHQVDAQNCFDQTSPHQVDAQNCFEQTSPHQVDAQNCFEQSPSYQVDAQNVCTPNSPDQVDAQNSFGHPSPHQVDSQNSFIQTATHQVDAQNSFVHTPPNQVEAQNCFVQTSPSHFGVQCLPPVLMQTAVPNNLVHIPIEINNVLQNQRRNDLVLHPQRDIFVQTPNGLSNMVFTVNKNNFPTVNPQSHLQNTYVQNTIVPTPFTQNIVQSPVQQNVVVQNPVQQNVVQSQTPLISKIPLEQLQRLGYRVIMQEVPIEF